jgi:hypothetical protein
VMGDAIIMLPLWYTQERLGRTSYSFFTLSCS